MHGAQRLVSLACRHLRLCSGTRCRAVSGGEDGTVRVWYLAHGVELASFASDNSITALAVTLPGTRVIAGTATGPVHLLELCAYEQPLGT